MKNLNHCIKTLPSTGLCEIDLDIAIKTFTNRCFISRWNNEYQLCRKKYKHIYAMKISISESDAKELIQKLDLIEEKSPIFRSGFTYYLKGTDVRKI